MKQIAIQFSGGKDSTALLHRCRDILDISAVYFGDTGAVYPHMVAFVRETCAELGAELRIVKPPMGIEDYHQIAGLPADIVPVEAIHEMATLMREQPKQLLQSNLACCNTMLWAPMYQRMVDDGIKVVLRGAKQSDAKRGVPSGTVDQFGIRYENPLWDWDDAKVFAYLDHVGAKMAPHYAEVNASFDCWLCTAYMTDAGAREKLAYTRKIYPELWPQLERRLVTVRETVEEAWAKVMPSLADIQETNDALAA